jgi:methionine-rich copper-binding protein CopC
MNNKKKQTFKRCLTLLLLSSLITPVTVFAHAIMVRSTPEKDAVVTEAPKQVDVWFNDKVGSEHKALAVIDDKGNRLDNEDVTQETFDGSHLYSTLKPLVPGVYTVRYRVVSADTHIVTGKYQFTVKAP